MSITWGEIKRQMEQEMNIEDSDIIHNIIVMPTLKNKDDPIEISAFEDGDGEIELVFRVY